jgi:hypothetical protein
MIRHPGQGFFVRLTDCYQKKCLGRPKEPAQARVAQII